MPSTPLVDVHAHFLTDEYVAAAIAAGIEHSDGMPQWPCWSAEQHLSLMQDNAIRHAILSLSSPGVSFAGAADAPALARHVNDVAARTVAAHPERFSFFASLPLPDVDAAISEAIRATDIHGAAGVVLLSNNGGRYLGDESLEPLWECLTTDAQLQRMWLDTAGHPLPTQAGVLRDVVGSNRILYGSDYCWTPAFAVGQQIAALDSDPETDWRAVTSANAHEFLQCRA
ncbi:amidohydrolase family protein [Mycolicibacterium sp. XJ775]